MKKTKDLLVWWAKYDSLVNPINNEDAKFLNRFTEEEFLDMIPEHIKFNVPKLKLNEAVKMVRYLCESI